MFILGTYIIILLIITIIIMENSNYSPLKTSAVDFFLNLGVIVALYATVMSFISLLFTVIDVAFSKTTEVYQYYNPSISMPIAILVISFPILILLSWILEKGYRTEPEKRGLAIRKWLSYLTLFVAGGVLAGDLIAVIYKFLDGQDLTTGFLLKALVVLLVAAFVFMHYLQDIRDKVSPKCRRTRPIVMAVIILASIIWGFSVLGSPATQRNMKYDNTKIMNLQEIQWQVISYWQMNGALPTSLEQMASNKEYFITVPTDPQNQKSYGYEKTGQMTFKLCAEFNNENTAGQNGYGVQVSYPKGSVIQNENWNHDAGEQCFTRVVDPVAYPTQVRG
ncbi:MAG: hypothetical protein A2431_03550 [Candidatus Zambryskibacteria bacterium RIFOXYC1_FULL_39_10]|uniref:DUF5671 domain-containing protein n=1 Tax=Candidatus Zambryskibacteria bacterium RIFOXYC1_FULL_39_10 TaxID=1802779 RepID=A0A1G2UYJ9_9BACT|nr:MAG: hypothetical protein A2431_03550 [Candidatus Zambryskibacteria bacterium RIFOXYC1_FULL_39_10]OHB16805.1 MAG: hypothetical protein A2605_01300 [Candidatus Zambryskibacteria bacterium RIFOXYD1_FULL_39_35]